ncbi:hypothetical protein OS493_003720 [Desmophyllum pertusum]|uniref:Uncharacterized protein n=1 Tax=Desmophyllum pertusum TaxID=174260 RepID=A0A9X0DB43_9CNID|nr:hypothetical protein OS493_003720 [Desmophyllum pertusum]
MYFNDEKIPKNESNKDAFSKCTSMEQAKIHCPKRYQAMLAWFEYVNTVLSDLEPKTNHMFYFTGKHRSTPSCPVQLAANFNPGTGSQKYKSSNKDCTKPALYRLPFFMENLGPRYNAFSVAAHEARPGHHTQSQREEDQYSKMKTHFNAVFFMAAVFLDRVAAGRFFLGLSHMLFH